MIIKLKHSGEMFCGDNILGVTLQEKTKFKYLFFKKKVYTITAITDEAGHSVVTFDAKEAKGIYHELLAVSKAYQGYMIKIRKARIRKNELKNMIREVLTDVILSMK